MDVYADEEDCSYIERVIASGHTVDGLSKRDRKILAALQEKPRENIYEILSIFQTLTSAFPLTIHCFEGKMQT